MAVDSTLLDKITSSGNTGFPGLLGIDVFHLELGAATAKLALDPKLMAPNGYLHAGCIVTLADTSCGYGCMASLPDGANSFTTVELKSNHLGTARDGVIICTANAAHLGRTTQVWDAVVSHEETGKTLALFRCTQMILTR